MNLFTDKYQKTGFIYSLTLSFIYLPLLLGVLDTNQFISNQICNLLVFISFSITFITTINYKIILTTKNRNSFLINKYILAPANFFFMYLIFIILPFQIDENVFTFSLLFIGIPWIAFFSSTWKKHNLSLITNL